MKNLLIKTVIFAIIFECCILSNHLFAVENVPKEYTIVIYLNGADLESDINAKTNKIAGWATAYLSELERSWFSDSQINIIVITGGTSRWVSRAISPIQTQAWQLSGSTKKGWNLRASLPASFGMMQKYTMATYMGWAIKEYPAKKYVLMLWGHAYGPVFGFGRDELNNDQAISITDIQWALHNSLNGKKLELLVFNCCLLGNFETAYKLRQYSKYMVGSEDLSYGDPKGLIKELAKDSSISGKKLGELFIDAHFKNYNGGRLYTFSLLDLAKVEQIGVHWDKLIQLLAQKMKNKDSAASVCRSLAIARGYCESYNEFQREGGGLTDMYTFADYISFYCGINTDELKKSITDCVIRNKVCSSRASSNGLSVFFVDRKLEENLGEKDVLEKYKPGAPSRDYFNFISDYYNKLFVQDPSKFLGEINFIKKPIVVQNSNSSHPLYSVDIEPGTLGDFMLVNQIFFVIGKFEGVGASKIFKTFCIDKNVSNDLGKISIDVTGKQYCIGGKPVAIYWDGNVDRWKNSKYVPLGHFAIKHDGLIKFLVVKEKAPNIVSIIDVFSQKDFNDSVVPRAYDVGDTRNIPKIGDTITLLYKGDGRYVDGPTVKLDSYDIGKSSLASGDYCGAFYIEDVIGRKTWSYRKDFTIDSFMRINSSNGKDKDKPMPENQGL